MNLNDKKNPHLRIFFTRIDLVGGHTIFEMLMGGLYRSLLVFFHTFL